MSSHFASLFGHDPVSYVPHRLHQPEQRTYVETNCYADVIIELLHARGDDPVCVFGSTVRMDFEGDQWTFFKPHPEDLEQLLGVDVHEMQLYRSLEAHMLEQLALGRTMIVELDAMYLPDTASTSYRREHVKSSAAIEAIDPEGRRLRYYHNSSLHELAADDYDSVLRTGVDPSGGSLPPYAEVVRFDEQQRMSGDALRSAARDLLRRHLDHAPTRNPFDAFGSRLGSDLSKLIDGSEADYHQYAFATVRMIGAGFELCAVHVDWVLGEAGRPAVEALGRIVDASKLLSFKLARRRSFDASTVIDDMARAWDIAIESLRVEVT